MSYFYSATTGGFHVDDAPLPGDAVPVTDEQHAAMMTAQAAGARIEAGEDGSPVAVLPTEAELAVAAAAMARESRDCLLAACDWRVMPDSPMSAMQRATWATYRQALRDWPDAPGWPDAPLPTPPEAA